MKRTEISQLKLNINNSTKIQGWIQSIRDKGKIQFIVIRDHSGTVQAILERAENPGLADVIAKLTSETAVTVVGKVCENPHVKMGGIEIQLKELHVENHSESPLPYDLFGKIKPELDFRINWRYLDLRIPENNLIFKVQTLIEMSMREFWIKDGFIEIHSPKLMGTPSESGAELFKVPYFEKTAYLAQSPQFYKQMAMAAGFNKVFEIGPVFRANPSFTSRHDTEFTSVDVEISWIDSHEDIMSFEEKWIKYILLKIKENFGKEIFAKFGVEVEVPDIPFPRISMKEAIKILQKEGYSLPTENKEDLDPNGERLLCKFIKEKYNHDFIFLTDYPVSVRPFYHMRHSSNSLLTKSFDLLWKGLEITTGAQREHRYKVLAQQALEKGLHLEPIQFYLDFFKHGCPPHGGFGFGLTRMLMILLNIKNVREVTFIYRGPNRLFP